MSSSTGVTALAINHVGIPASDLAASAVFYAELGLTVVPSFAFDTPVRWLGVGVQQLHLVESAVRPSQPAHVALVVDDFAAAAELAERRGWRVLEPPLFAKVSRLPDGSAQLFVRDPAGNLVELLHPDAATVDRARVPLITDLADEVTQDEVARKATLFPPRAPQTEGDEAARVFARHGEALLATDFDALLDDYADDAVLLTPTARWEGKDEIGRFFVDLIAQLSEPSWKELSTTIVDDVILHEWAAQGASGEIQDGIDTLLIRDGRITVQTVRYTLRMPDSDTAPR